MDGEIVVQPIRNVNQVLATLSARAAARRLCYIRLVHRPARWIVPRRPRPASVVTGYA